MLYDFEVNDNVVERAKKISCTKSKINYSTITKWFEKFCKKLNNQEKSVRSKTMDCKAQNHRAALREYQGSSKPSKAAKFCLTCYQNIAKLLTHPSNNKACKI